MSGDTTIIFPKGNIQLEGANAIVANTPHRVFAVGQKLAAGTATSGELQEQIGNDNSWDTLFGEKSMLAAMIRAFKGSLTSPLNRVSRIDAIGLEDAGGGSEATGEISFADGAATADGSIIIIIGSSKHNTYTIAYSSGDTEDVIGIALKAAIDADSKSQVTTSAAVGPPYDLTLTAQHKGTVGNGIGIRVIGAIPGIAISVTAMSGGATDPTLTTLFDPVATERYQTIMYPANWGFDTLTDFLDARFNSGGQLLDGVGLTALVDTETNLKAAANAENSPSLVIYGDAKVDETLYRGPAIMELPYETIGYAAGIRALRLTDGASISRFVVGNAGLDNFGGVYISSKPYANTPYPDSPVIPAGKGFSQTQIEALKAAGIAVRGNNIPKNGILSGEVVTTYKTDGAGNPDKTFQFLNSVDQGTAFRELQYNNIHAKYAQSRLVDGSLIPRHPSVNEDELRRYLAELFALAGTPDYSLVVSGAAALRFFRENLTVSIDFQAGKATIFEVVPLVSQFRAFDAILQLRFDVPIGG